MPRHEEPKRHEHPNVSRDKRDAKASDTKPTEGRQADSETRRVPADDQTALGGLSMPIQQRIKEQIESVRTRSSPESAEAFRRLLQYDDSRIQTADMAALKGDFIRAGDRNGDGQMHWIEARLMLEELKATGKHNELVKILTKGRLNDIDYNRKHDPSEIGQMPKLPDAPAPSPNPTPPDPAPTPGPSPSPAPGPVPTPPPGPVDLHDLTKTKEVFELGFKRAQQYAAGLGYALSYEPSGMRVRSAGEPSPIEFQNIFATNSLTGEKILLGRVLPEKDHLTTLKSPDEVFAETKQLIDARLRQSAPAAPGVDQGIIMFRDPVSGHELTIDPGKDKRLYNRLIDAQRQGIEFGYAYDAEHGTTISLERGGREIGRVRLGPQASDIELRRALNIQLYNQLTNGFSYDYPVVIRGGFRSTDLQRFGISFHDGNQVDVGGQTYAVGPQTRALVFEPETVRGKPTGNAILRSIDSPSSNPPSEVVIHPDGTIENRNIGGRRADGRT